MRQQPLFLPAAGQQHCPCPGRLWTGGRETSGAGSGGGIVPVCLPDACPSACLGPAPERSFRARSNLQSWEGATASASWQRKYWEGRQAAGRPHSSSHITWLEEDEEEEEKE